MPEPADTMALLLRSHGLGVVDVQLSKYHL